MTGEDLTWFQFAARGLFVFALVCYGAVALGRLLRRLGGLIPRRPRVVTMHRHRQLMQRK